MEDLAELKTLARIDTLITVVEASTLLMDLEGVQLLKVGWLVQLKRLEQFGWNFDQLKHCCILCHRMQWRRTGKPPTKTVSMTASSPVFLSTW